MRPSCVEMSRARRMVLGSRWARSAQVRTEIDPWVCTMASASVSRVARRLRARMPRAGEARRSMAARSAHRIASSRVIRPRSVETGRRSADCCGRCGSRRRRGRSRVASARAGSHRCRSHSRRPRCLACRGDASMNRCQATCSGRSCSAAAMVVAGAQNHRRHACLPICRALDRGRLAQFHAEKASMPARARARASPYSRSDRLPTLLCGRRRGELPCGGRDLRLLGSSSGGASAGTRVPSSIGPLRRRRCGAEVSRSDWRTVADAP